MIKKTFFFEKKVAFKVKKQKKRRKFAPKIHFFIFTNYNTQIILWHKKR